MTLPSGVSTWYVRFRVPNGKQVMHRLGRANIINATIAREMALQTLVAANKGEYQARACNAVTMASLLERIKREHWPRLRPNTQRQQEMLWRVHLLPTFGKRCVCTITSDDVARWLHQASVKPITANRALEVLSKAMNLAELWNLRPQHSNPCRHITANRERKRRRYLSRDELARLLAALDEFTVTANQLRFAQMIRLLLLTGCRVGEIQRARWDWINLDAGILVIPAAEHKTGGDGEDRVVHLPPAAVEILSQLRQRTNKRWVIAGRGDHPLIAYSELWARLCKQAGIENLRVHDLRHNWASTAISAGLTLAQIGEQLGHRSAQTTHRYAHLIGETAAQNAAKVAALISDKGSFRKDAPS
jgi:integrase